jgi:hypothetical protein
MSGTKDATQTSEQATPDDFDDICALVNGTPVLQSLLYDLNLLPEQTMRDPLRWGHTQSVAYHMLDAAIRQAAKAAGAMKTEPRHAAAESSEQRLRDAAQTSEQDGTDSLPIASAGGVQTQGERKPCACDRFFAKYRCAVPLDCDCPRCQGYCEKCESGERKP